MFVLLVVSGIVVGATIDLTQAAVKEYERIQNARQ
jgi:hypothetical protein